MGGRFGRDPPYHRRPLLFFEQGRVILNFARRLLTGSPDSPRTLRIPPMTEAQAEALDAVHFIAEENCLKIAMERGEIRYINNLAVLHRRDAFTDSEHTQRHLVRLWLRDSRQAWPIPSGLQMASDRIFAGPYDAEERWDLDPILDQSVLIGAKRSCGQG